MSPGWDNSQYKQLSLAPFMATNKVPVLIGKEKQNFFFFFFVSADQLQLEFLLQETKVSGGKSSSTSAKEESLWFFQLYKQTSHSKFYKDYRCYATHFNTHRHKFRIRIMKALYLYTEFCDYVKCGTHLNSRSNTNCWQMEKELYKSK